MIESHVCWIAELLRARKIPGSEPSRFVHYGPPTLLIFTFIYLAQIRSDAWPGLTKWARAALSLQGPWSTHPKTNSSPGWPNGFLLHILMSVFSHYPLSQAERRDIVNSAISTWFSLMTMDEARKMSSLPNAVYRKSLNGHRIRIGRAETAYLDFQTPMGEQHCIKMSIPLSAVPKDEDDSRITWLSVI